MFCMDLENGSNWFVHLSGLGRLLALGAYYDTIME